MRTLLALAACAGLAVPPSAGADGLHDAPRPNLDAIRDRLVGTIVREERLHIATSADWRRFWRRFDGGEPPPVDFARHDVLAFVMAPQPSGGYFVRITGVRSDAAGSEVGVLVCSPPADTPQVAEVTAPHDLVLVPKLRPPVRWKPVAGRTGRPPCL